MSICSGRGVAKKKDNAEHHEMKIAPFLTLIMSVFRREWLRRWPNCRML
jgi:hypothetical protein